MFLAKLDSVLDSTVLIPLLVIWPLVEENHLRHGFEQGIR